MLEYLLASLIVISMFRLQLRTYSLEKPIHTRKCLVNVFNAL
jgi:hypothetical protein